MPEENIIPIPSGTEIPKGDATLTSGQTSTSMQTTPGNIFLEEGKSSLTSSRTQEEDTDEQNNNVSK